MRPPESSSGDHYSVRQSGAFSPPTPSDAIVASRDYNAACISWQVERDVRPGTSATSGRIDVLVEVEQVVRVVAPLQLDQPVVVHAERLAPSVVVVGGQVVRVRPVGHVRRERVEGGASPRDARVAGGR